MNSLNDVAEHSKEIETELSKAVNYLIKDMEEKSVDTLIGVIVNINVDSITHVIFVMNIWKIKSVLKGTQNYVNIGEKIQKKIVKEEVPVSLCMLLL